MIRRFLWWLLETVLSLVAWFTIFGAIGIAYYLLFEPKVNWLELLMCCSLGTVLLNVLMWYQRIYAIPVVIVDDRRTR